MDKETKKIDFSFENFNLNYNQVNELIEEIELIKRRKIIDKDIITYIDPLNHVAKLQRAVNHIIVGRRGSGKTSLLIKIREILEKKGHRLIFVDIQKLRKASGEDIVVYILSELMKDITSDISRITNWKPIEERYVKKGFWDRILKRTPEFTSLLKNQNDLDEIYLLAKHLYEQLCFIGQMEEGATVNKVLLHNKEKISSRKWNVGNETELNLKLAEVLKNKTSFDVKYSNTKSDSINETTETKSEKAYSKESALKELQVDIFELVNDYFLIRKKSIFLFLDDFYQIKMAIQPFIYNFLHEISKETSSGAFCFNTCVVPNKFKLNFDDEKVLSHKDDFVSIVLDREFDDLEANKDMLLQILCGVKPELKLDKKHIVKLFNDTHVINKTIFASGVLPRVFLDVFELMVRLSRADNKLKIHNDVFHEAIKELSRGKDELIIEEADLDQESIRRLRKILENEVANGCKTNVVLYPMDTFERHERILTTLFNLGYIHRIKEEQKLKGISFVPIMLDMTFTHGSKSFPKGFKMVNFWDRKKYKNENCAVWQFDSEIVNEILSLNQE